MITVLTTVRNGIPFLQEAISSVRAQQYRNFQHCVVDDGSSDGTTDFLKTEENRDITVVYESPIGRGKALNVGGARCQTDLLAILDADDSASPYWLAVMAEVMTDNPDIDVLCCNGVLEKGKVDVGPPTDTVSAYRLSPKMFLYRNPVSHSGTLIRMDAFREAGGYDESRDCLFDYDLWVRLLKRGKQIWHVNWDLIFKRIHSGQHFERKNRLHYLRASYQIRKSISNDLLGGSGAIIPALAYLYGLLPRRFRHWIYSRT